MNAMKPVLFVGNCVPILMDHTPVPVIMDIC